MGILQDVFSPQDVIAPVNISLTYVYKNNGVMIPQHLEFPINPEELTKDIDSSSDSVDIEGLGEVSIPKSPSLAKLSIKSFFWQQMNMNPSIFYVRWLERWQRSKLQALLVVTRFDYSMWVTCENFNYTIKAGEENDIYFELELREYKEYGAKTIASLAVDENKKAQILEIAEASAEAMLVTIPPPSRMIRAVSEITELDGGKYKCKYGDTILTICAKFDKNKTDEWKELVHYNSENEKNLVHCAMDDNFELPENCDIYIPPVWLNGDEAINA